MNKPVTATLKVCFVDIVWKNKKGAGIVKVRSMASQCTRVYKKISDNRFVIKPTVKSIAVPYNHAARNLNKAVSFIKNQVGNYDIYVVVHSNVRNYSNAGVDIAYLKSVNIRTCLHEIGHLKPLSLKHAGKYVKDKLDEYGDNTSFMSRYPTYDLSAPQLCYLGWIDRSKVAELAENALQPVGISEQFTLEPIAAKKPSDSFKLVQIYGGGRDLFLSVDRVNKKKVFRLHYLTKGGGSQLVKTFKKQFVHAGLKYKLIASKGKDMTVEISGVDKT